MALLEKNSSYEISRRTQPFYAKKQSYNLGEQVQIEVDLQREFIDFQNSRLVFDFNFTTNGTDNKLSKWFASQIVKNLRVKTLAGQMIGHEIREYRAFYQMYKELTSNSDKNESYDDILEGANGTGATINVDATAESIQFAHKFIAHIFSIKEYYPAHFHQGIMIEFDLPSSVTQLVSGAAAATSVSISDVKYVADLVQLKPEMETELVNMMEQQRLFADYKEVLTQENTLQNNTGLQAYDVIGIDGRVKSIFTYALLAADRTGASEATQYFANWGRKNLSNYRYKLGANYLNYESISCSTDKRAEQTYELLKALDIHDNEAMKTKCGDSALTWSAQDSTRFASAVKVDKAQKDSDEVISSMIDKDRNNVRVELNYSAQPGANGVIYTHVCLDKRIQILPGSIIRNVRN